jgi:hypothetical protein
MLRAPRVEGLAALRVALEFVRNRRADLAATGLRDPGDADTVLPYLPDPDGPDPSGICARPTRARRW